MTTRRASSTVQTVASRTLPTHVWFIDLFRGCVGKVRVAKRYPRGHVVTRRGIKCQGCAGEYCTAEATRCEYMPWSSGPGTSFFYYCDKHWITEGPNGTSPRDRAWIGFEAVERKEIPLIVVKP